jgi:hypothetical protein
MDFDYPFGIFKRNKVGLSVLFQFCFISLERGRLTSRDR